MKNLYPIYLLTLIASIAGSGCAPIWLAGGVAGAGATIASDRRDTSRIIEDQALEMSVTDSIYSDKEMGKRVRISVTSFNGIVLLTGEAPTDVMRLQAAKMAREMMGVREIYNEVHVSEPIPLNNRTHDSWIASKVKGRLVANRGLFTRTKVITSNGIVYLMGLATQAEAKEATDIAAAIEGAEGVVALFEPIDDVQALPTRMVRGKANQTPPAASTAFGRTPQEEASDLSVVPFSTESQVKNAE